MPAAYSDGVRSKNGKVSVARRAYKFRLGELENEKDIAINHGEAWRLVSTMMT
jgi:hypothetical protein